ncbi:GNAT family N-acetyltransferase [Haladaptatus halobius]|uniref:GNAT family N-acetyltransferase n=1 Tax=Haladaptatus halobius TaxID=2884875 RepID=UPI001D0A2B9B|nr:GNAT family protein [Haladaptatus halobius]
MPGVAFLRGDRVTLRTIEHEDIAIIQRAYNEPDFQQGFLIESPVNQHMIEERIEETVEEDDDSIFLLTCVDENPIGGVSVRKMRQSHGMLAYWLLPEERGQGYMTESAALLVNHAFTSVGLHRIFAWMIDDNEASQAVLQRLGFTHEGTYREHVFTRGAYHDTEHYGLLETEWKGIDPTLQDH